MLHCEFNLCPHFETSGNSCCRDVNCCNIRAFSHQGWAAAAKRGMGRCAQAHHLVVRAILKVFPRSHIVLCNVLVVRNFGHFFVVLQLRRRSDSSDTCLASATSLDAPPLVMLASQAEPWRPPRASPQQNCQRPRCQSGQRRCRGESVDCETASLNKRHNHHGRDRFSALLAEAQHCKVAESVCACRAFFC